MKKRSEKGFTLMELMVVIVIVAILAAVAVPLYINYVKDAQRTEAKGAIGAIITAEQTHFQRFGDYLTYSNAQFGATPSDVAAERLDVDVTEALRNWQFEATAEDQQGEPGFTIVATQNVTGNATALKVTYTLRPAAGDDQWKDE